MVRDVDLVSYLPPFLADYKETNLTLAAQDPEFVLVWKAADRALRNGFIATADEYGISRFEKMLGIFPAEGEPLESRRQAVLLKWTAALPYTMRRLRECLSATLGDGGYILQGRAQEYFLHVTIVNKADGVYRAVDRMLSGWVPMNMGYGMESRCAVGAAAGLYVGAARTGFIRIEAKPVKDDAAYRAEAKVAIGVAVYGYYRASYLPKGGA